MSCKSFFEVLFLVSLYWTIITAAATPGLLPQDKCGVSSAPNQATDANKAGLHEYPWIAGINYKSARGTKITTRCTGTLINKRYILTAALCVDTGRSIPVGVTLGGIEKGAPPLQEFSISEKDIIVYPGFKFIDNDIALIRLPSDADDSTIPVCLPIQDSARDNQFEHDLTVAGWFFYSGKSNPEFEKVSVPVVPNTKCAEKYVEHVNITEKHLCGEDVMACAHNGGSPLMDQVDLDGVIRTVQYGLVSFGPTGCNQLKNVPAGYTRVSAYTDWILENIKA